MSTTDVFALADEAFERDVDSEDTQLPDEIKHVLQLDRGGTPEAKIKLKKKITEKPTSMLGLTALTAEQLPEEFDRIYTLRVSHGEQTITSAFQPRVSRWFTIEGDKDSSVALARAQNQRIIRVGDMWTCEQAVYNPLRGLRPMAMKPYDARHTATAVPDCDFCRPLSYTAEDPWGRLYRSTCSTASNVAKSAPCHSLIIFTAHNPLVLEEGLIADIISISEEWFDKAHAYKTTAAYPTLTWNCNARAGASQPHGHAQLLLDEGSAYATYDRLRDVCARYKAQYTTHYFDDQIRILRTLGLTHSFGRAVVAVPLVPKLTTQLTVICPNWRKGSGEQPDTQLLCDFEQALEFAVLTAVHTLGFRAFNVNVSYPPMDLSSTYADLPVYGVVLDRGDSGATSDVCSLTAMAFCNATDPFVTMQTIRSKL